MPRRRAIATISNVLTLVELEEQLLQLLLGPVGLLDLVHGLGVLASQWFL